jgi:hypothetical protein
MLPAAEEVRMKPTATIAAVLLAVALGAFSLEMTRPTSLIAKAAMPDPGLTGAPSEGTCFTCHSGGLDDADGIIQIYNVPASYAPGQTYGIGVVLVRVFGSSRWGFEVTALTSGNQMAGTLDDNNNFVGKQISNGITYVSQTTQKGFDGTYSDSAGGAWTFYWTAPPIGTGPVTFYAAGAACDKDNSANAGDFTYTTSVSSTEGSPTAVEPTTWGRIKQIYR